MCPPTFREIARSTIYAGRSRFTRTRIRPKRIATREFARVSRKIDRPRTEARILLSPFETRIPFTANVKILHAERCAVNPEEKEEEEEGDKHKLMRKVRINKTVRLYGASFIDSRA